MKIGTLAIWIVVIVIVGWLGYWLYQTYIGGSTLNNVTNNTVSNEVVNDTVNNETTSNGVNSVPSLGTF